MQDIRGMSLEREFAQWMENELGYSKTKLRIPVKGKVADRSYEVDIYAEKFSHLWDVLRFGGIVSFLAAGLVLLAPRDAQGLRHWMEQTVAGFVPDLAPYALLVFGIGGFVLGYNGKRKAMTYAWVECKDMRSNVKRAHVQKLAAAVDDAEQSRDAKWKPDTVILVSGTDFDADAINFAREHGFLCYRRSRSGFEQVEIG